MTIEDFLSVFSATTLNGHDFFEQIKMSSKYDGVFSAGLLSLQLQLKNLLEGVGGDHAIQLLDALCRMSESEQKVALDVFTRALEKIASSEKRLFTDGDLALKEFEDNLYNDIVAAMEGASKSPKEHKFAVLNGGKNSNPLKVEKFEGASASTIDFEKARKSRKLRISTAVN